MICALACIGTVLSLISPCSKSTADFGRTIMFVTLLLVTLFFPSSSSPPRFFFCASSSSSARVFVAYNLRLNCCCCCRRSFPNALSCVDVNDDDGERKNLNLLLSLMSFAAIVAIDDDDAPGSLLPRLLPLLLHALVVVVLPKLALRVLLVLALRSERRSCKSVRLILFPLETNLHQPSVVGENNGRESVACSTRQRMTCARAEVKPTNFEKRRVFKERVFLGPSLSSFSRERSLFNTLRAFPLFLFRCSLTRDARRERADDLSLSVILHEY